PLRAGGQVLRPVRADADCGRGRGGEDVRKAARGQFQRAVAGAASLTGKRFGLLVASSLVATSAIVATAISHPSGNGLLAAALARGLAVQAAPAASTSAPEPSGGGSSPPLGGGSSPSAPIA